ncbi:MAG: MlaD family protein [Deltaproteobacteria bacterium]|jgi:phospholipid/cholesterol/gamma-HCH transport system substrate-binding protein/paraquat-inducible protein B|nr:MlaD family protein [Deltaproteobacteria bacterium]
MSKPPNYFKIGLFTLSALVLLASAILYFGLFSVFKEVLECETFFDHSVQGLSKGGAVNFRGFRVGQVSAIALPRLAEHDGQQLVKVEFFLDPHQLSGLPDTTAAEARDFLEKEMGKGLRCYLTYQGVSGLAFLDLDYVNDDVFDEPPTLGASKRLTIPSAQGSVMEISQSLSRIVRSFRSVDFSALSRSLQSTLSSIERLSTTLTVQSEARSADLARTLTSLDQAAANIIALAGSLTAETEGLELKARSEQLRASLDQIKSSMRQLDAVLRGPRDSLPSTLENLRIMSENFRELSEMARRYPSQLLFGQPPTEVKPR